MYFGSMSKFCLPIIAQSKSDVLNQLEHHSKDYDFFEIWLDYVEDLNLPFVKKLISREGERLILILRRLKHGGVLLNRDIRRQLMSHMSGGKTHLDLDFRSQAEDLEYFKKSNVNAPLTITFQSIEFMPSQNDILNAVNGMMAFRPHTIRFILFCKTELDAVRLMELKLQLRDLNINSIVQGVGLKAHLANLLIPLWNNRYEVVRSPEQSHLESYASLTKAEFITQSTLLEKLKL